jgi:hypothetical protein
MTEKFTLIAFTSVISEAGRDFHEEAPFKQQKANLSEIELRAYDAIITDIRRHGIRSSSSIIEAHSDILFKGHGIFQLSESPFSRMVFGRYAVVNFNKNEVVGILVLFMGSNLKGPNTIEMIGLRRFKPFIDGSPNYATITHIIAPEPKRYEDGF